MTRTRMAGLLSGGMPIYCGPLAEIFDPEYGEKATLDDHDFLRDTLSRLGLGYDARS